jgi:hypothetical protein
MTIKYRSVDLNITIARDEIDGMLFSLTDFINSRFHSFGDVIQGCDLLISF